MLDYTNVSQVKQCFWFGYQQNDRCGRARNRYLTNSITLPLLSVPRVTSKDIEQRQPFSCHLNIKWLLCSVCCTLQAQCRYMRENCWRFYYYVLLFFNLRSFILNFLYNHFSFANSHLSVRSLIYVC